MSTTWLTIQPMWTCLCSPGIFARPPGLVYAIQPGLPSLTSLANDLEDRGKESCDLWGPSHDLAVNGRAKLEKDRHSSALFQGRI